VADSLGRPRPVLLGVDGEDGGKIAVPIALVDPLHLEFLDVAGIGQHVGQQIPRCLGGEDRPGEAVFQQFGQEAGVVDVGVGQEDGIDGGRIEGEIAVVELADGFGALEHPAVDQEAEAGDRDVVARAGYRAGGAAELDFELHQPFLRFLPKSAGCGISS